MSEQDDIDIRRAKQIPRQQCCYPSRSFCMSRPGCFCVDLARAIRLSDEAAGYITAKLEGVVNEKDRRS